MRIEEERKIIEWVYLTARSELRHIQKSIETMQLYWRGLKENKEDYKEFEQVLEQLHVFEKTLQNLLMKIKKRLTEEDMILMCRKLSDQSCSDCMEKRVAQLKYQIHENKHAGIFAWELAKELIAQEEALVNQMKEPW